MADVTNEVMYEVLKQIRDLLGNIESKVTELKAEMQAFRGIWFPCSRTSTTSTWSSTVTMRGWTGSSAGCSWWSRFRGGGDLCPCGRPGD